MRPAPEDAADDAFDQREYPIPERLESQRRAWRFERARPVGPARGDPPAADRGCSPAKPLSSRTLVSAQRQADPGLRAFRTQRRRQPPAHRSAWRAGHRGGSCAWAADCYRRTASRACNRNRGAVTAGGVAWNWREGSTKTVA
ncbi:hypothetical protein ACPA9J_18605 [Pseudomonas aeruginosa]